MKHHILAKFINDIKNTAVKFKDHQCLREQLKQTVEKYLDLTSDIDESMIVEWLAEDKNILGDALKEIYANRGEDKYIARVCNKAFRKVNDL